MDIFDKYKLRIINNKRYYEFGFSAKIYSYELTHAIPYLFKYKDITIQTSGWSQLAIKILNYLYEKNGKKKVVERKKFPGYVFVKLIETAHICFMVTNTRGVTNFVGPVGKATPLSEDEVKRLGLEKVEFVDVDLKAGDSVRVVNGALESFIGVVEDISLERQKVKVIVSMFGRQTPVELDLSQVEKIQG